MSKAICLLYRDGEYIQTLLSFIFFLIQITQNVNAEIVKWTEFGNAHSWQVWEMIVTFMCVGIYAGVCVDLQPALYK